VIVGAVCASKPHPLAPSPSEMERGKKARKDKKRKKTRGFTGGGVLEVV
jgi:hypothetical protein